MFLEFFFLLYTFSFCIRVNQVPMDLSELLELSDYRARQAKEVQPENPVKQDLQVHLESLDILVTLVKKVLKDHLDLKANKAPLVPRACQDSPAREVLQDYQ